MKVREEWVQALQGVVVMEEAVSLEVRPVELVKLQKGVLVVAVGKESDQR